MNNLLSEHQHGLSHENLDPPTYSLISIGQRGSGKTVFLTSSYAQSKLGAANGSRGHWALECEDPEAEEKIKNVLNYIVRTGEYPPATMKITNFDFNLQRHYSGVKKTIGRVCWWDTPGESCKIHNPAFLSMVIYSQGCCLFLDAQSLVNKSRKPQELNTLIHPIQTIADILQQNNLKHPLALIITKCDLLGSKVVNWQILHKNLSPLTDYLSGLNINFKIFYSEVSIQQIQGYVPFPDGHVNLPLTWLVEEMKKADGTLAIEEGSHSSLQTARSSERLTARSQPNFSLTRFKVFIFFILLILAGLGGFLIHLLLFPQKSPSVLPSQPNEQPISPSRQ